MTPSKPRFGALNPIKLLLLLPLLLLIGCASNSQVCPPVLQTLPAPPLMSTQQPQESYSERAQRNINGWQNKLTDTALMRK